jgi:hypothetical protein
MRANLELLDPGEGKPGEELLQGSVGLKGGDHHPTVRLHNLNTASSVLNLWSARAVQIENDNSCEMYNSFRNTCTTTSIVEVQQLLFTLSASKLLLAGGQYAPNQNFQRYSQLIENNNM